jgi:hypothetical protein
MMGFVNADFLGLLLNLILLSSARGINNAIALQYFTKFKDIPNMLAVRLD